MPTIRSRVGQLSLVLALLAGATGCSLFADDSDTPESAAPVGPPPDVVAALQDALDRRAEAVRNHDAAGFMAGLAPGHRTWRARQRTYFDNLVQLPLGIFDYHVDPAAVADDGDSYLVEVELRTQLSGFDDRPVVTHDRMRLEPAATPGQYVVSGALDTEWMAGHDWLAQPWELGPVVVRTVPGVLGVFDAGSVATADRLLADVRQAITDVSASVPLPWDRAVVVYALSRPAFLDSIPQPPGGDPTALDGVAFPVFAELGKPAIASTRFVLHPRLLSHEGLGRARLIRHELTHVAIGRRDDHAPVWLSEGLAEYVSVRPLPPEQRGISQSAIDAARAGFTDLPSDASFNDGDSQAHYGEAWWACEYVAANYGEPALWSLLDQLDDPKLDAAGRSAVLRTWIGLTGRELARRAGKQLLLTFDPAGQP